MNLCVMGVKMRFSATVLELFVIVIIFQQPGANTQDPCLQNPCQNNGLCTSSGATFTCTCFNPWTGPTCSVLSNTNSPCNSNPCLNNGACVRDNNAFQCFCPGGFSGPRCQTSDGTSQGVADPCIPNPCMNGVTCTTFNSDHYRCDCQNGFVGLNCEVQQTQTDTCSPNPCLNGGACSVIQTTGGTGPQCACNNNEYSGDRCQYHITELCQPGSQGAIACGSRVCLARNVPGEPNYVCVCTGSFEQGHDCTPDSDARTVISCYGTNCLRRVNELGQSFTYFESPDFPQLYEDRLRIEYLLYLPGVSEICFDFDPRAFGIEDNKDELYVGAGLRFDFADLDGRNTRPDIFFFENSLLPPGRTTPLPFCVPSDTVWMYFLTDKNIMLPGFRLSWNVADTEPPVVINCPNNPSPIRQTVTLGSAGSTVSWIEPTATDDSGETPILFRRSHAPGSFFPVNQVTTVTYIFRDGAGNEGSCSFAVFVDDVDAIPPVVTGPTQTTITRTVPCNVGSTLVSFPEPTATDNSGIVNLISRSHAPGASFNLGTTVVTYVFADVAGNQATFTYNINVQTEVDNAPPTCLPTDSVTMTVPLEVSSTSVIFTEPQAQDACGPVTLESRSHQPGSTFNVGNTQVEYVFRDIALNSITCSLNVIVRQVDLIPPVITGDGTIRVTTPLGSGGRTVTFTPPGATDNSGTAILQGSTHNSGQFFPTGTTTVTYTYIDPSGNSATYDFDIVVAEIDGTPPIITTGPNGNNNPTGAGVGVTTECTTTGTTVSYTEPTAFDNSGTVTLASRTHTPGQFFTTGTTPVTYRFVDPAGNSVTYTFDVVVTSVDTMPPTCNPTVSPNVLLTTPLNSPGAIATWAEPSAVDTCGTVNLISRTAAPGSRFAAGTTPVIYTFADRAGNSVMCRFDVIVTPRDGTPPVITGPGGRTDGIGGRVQVDTECTRPQQGTRVTFAQPTATDNSGTATLVSQTHQSGQVFPIGTTPVTYTYEDPTGNVATYTFDVVVNLVDSTPPVCTAPNDIDIQIPLNAGGASRAYVEPTATDTCSTVTLVSRSASPGDFFTTGSTRVTYVFNDVAGNSVTCGFNVRVNEVDGTGPIIVTGPNGNNNPTGAGVGVTTECTTTGTTVSYVEPTASDNSGTVTLASRTHTPGQFFTTGTTPVTYRFVDPAGNSVTYTFDVVVTSVDTMPPSCVPSASPNVQVTTGLNNPGTTATWAEPSAVDLCGPATLISRSAAPGSTFTTGTTPVIYTFADSSGNTVMCRFDVIVTEVDGTPPIITGPGGRTDSIGNRIQVDTECVRPAQGRTVTYTEPTAIDNSGTATLVSQSHRSGQVFPIGTTPVTYRFADSTGNVATLTFDVVVNEVDSTPPVCTAPNDIDIQIPLNAGGASRAYVEPTATDTCSTVTLVSRSASPGDFFTTGSTRVTYVFNDVAGNSVTCGFNVRVTEVDGTGPIIVTGPNDNNNPTGAGVGVTTECTTTGTTVSYVEPTASDNSGTVTLASRTHTPGQFFPTGTTPVTYRFVDPAGNSVTYTFDVVVTSVDTMPPSCVPSASPNVQVTTGLNNPGTTATWAEPSAVDLCGPATLISRSAAPGSTFTTGTTPVIYTFADSSGNTVMCRFDVIVTEVDGTPPIITGPGGRTDSIGNRIQVDTECVRPAQGRTVTYTEPTAIDNSGTATLVSQSHRSGQVFPIGTTPVTYRFADSTGNVATLTFDVVVNEVDTTQPTCTAPGDINVEIPLGLGGANRGYVEPSATDVCGTVTLINRSAAPGDFFNTGLTRVTYVFSDDSGNTVACGFNVQITEVDRIPPVPTGNGDVRVEIPLNGGSTTVDFTVPTATDNSGSTTIVSRTHVPGDRFNTGRTTVTYVFRDPSGNEATYEFDVVVDEVDRVPPVVTGDGNVRVTIPLGGGGTNVDFNVPTATDNSGTTTLVSRTHSPGDRFNTGRTTVTYIYTDPSGNRVTYDFDIIVDELDMTPPVIIGPDGTANPGSTVIINADCTESGTIVSYNAPTAFDNSGTATLVSQTHQPGQFFPVGTTPVTYRFADPTGNIASYTFDVVVNRVDNTPPTCTPPNDVAVTIPLNRGSALATWNEPIVMDDCGTVTLVSRSANSGATFNTGSTRVTYVYQDDAGNTITCGFNVQVTEVDTEAPVITGPNNMVVTIPLSIPIPGQGQTTVTWTPPRATDNSGSTTLVSQSHFSGGTFMTGTTTVTYVYRDPSGNEATFEFDIVVNEVDEIPPNILGPGDVTVTTPLGSGGAIVTWPTITATDNSGTATLVSSTHTPGTRFNTGTTTVTYTYRDPSGNESTYTFNVNVIEVDEVAPNVICPANVQHTALTGQGGMNLEWNEPQAFDNSGTATLISRSATPGSFFPMGETMVTYRFADPSGNSASCTFSVLISEANPCLPEPCLNGGTCVIESPIAFSCLCSDCYSGNTCQTGDDPCANSNCANGATCIPFANSCTQYYCECPVSFTGQFCTQRVDACENHQCQNGAQCTVDPNDFTKYKCQCPSCFTGQFCQNTFSACTNHQCTNGGQCVATLNGGCTEYTCACSGCFTGLFCESNRDPCSINPCLNGAVCRQVTGSCFSYSCECNGCFTGFNCELAISNPCNNSPCQNGGICNVIPGECFAYACRCSADFAGINCEQAIPCNDNPCASQPCLNGGSCLTMDANYHICVCPENYLGINCQTLRAVQIGFDACLSNPCTNGQCYNSFNSISAPNNIFERQYTCVCGNGFTGVNCGLRTTAVPALDICSGGNRPTCRNGGQCFNDYHSYDQDVDYFCQCQQNFVGHNCETFFTDPCTSSPCQGLAQCTSMGTFFSCSCPGGLTGTLCQVDIVMDSIPPSIRNCPQSQSVFATAGQPGAQATWVEPTAQDNMDPNPTLVRQSHTPNTFFQTGRTGVTYVFTDDAMNAGTCTFFITVYSINDDVTPPTITGCPGNVIVGAQADGQGGIAQWTEPRATDNSGIDPIRSTTHTPNNRFPLGVTRVTYTFTDVAGNSAICSFNVDVVSNTGPDTIPPTIRNCPQTPLIVPINPTTPGGGFTLVEWTLPTAVDSSGTATLEFSNFDEPRVLFQHGNAPVTVEYRFRDASGNRASCIFDVSVASGGDTIAPQFQNCPSSVQVEVPVGQQSGSATWANLIVTDNSGGIPTLVEQTHSSGDTFPLGGTQVRYVYADGSGNRATCSFTLTVFMMMGTTDVTPPQFTFCPNDIIVSSQPLLNFDRVAWTLPTATDESGMVTLASVAPFDNEMTTSTFVRVGTDGLTDVTYTFTDPSGNEAVCQFQVGAMVNAPNPCLAAPCQNGATCNQITNSYECSCQGSFGGNKCHLQLTTATGPCAPNPCSNNGFCLTSSDGQSFTCECQNGYTGSTCQTAPTTNACSPNPCANNGNCQPNNNGQTFTCNCVNGFTGTRCQTAPNACGSAPCFNNGNCQNTNNGQTFACNCVNGFTGTRCQTAPTTNACSPNPCANNGNCQSTNNGQTFACSCVNGFTGTRCQTAPSNACSPNPCANNGNCQSTNNGQTFTCNCVNGFSGTRCQTAPITSSACSSAPCLNNGNCQNTNIGGYTCACVNGYSGNRCQTAPGNPCASNPCPVGQLCFYTTVTFICQANSGRKRRQTQDWPCLNGGVLEEDGYTARCICQPGFDGVFCEDYVKIDVCLPNPCAHNGSCTDLSLYEGGRPGDFACTCVPGWTGQLCQEAAEHETGLQPITENYLILNETLILGLALLIFVILILAVLLCILTTRLRHLTPYSKTSKSDEVALVH